MAQLLGGSTVGNYLILSKGNHYNLEHHDDVNITSIADGEILTWDNTNSYWKNETLAEAGIQAAGAIGDATLTLNTSGTGLSGSQTFTANATSGATFTVTSNATNANTASTIVARDASGNFSAGTITASLTGIASQVNVQDHTSNNIEYPVVWHNNTSSLYDTVSKFTFNPSTGALTATGGFIGNLTGTASSATWADTVDVNTSDSATWYNMVWHSGDTLYSSTGVQYQGSTDSLRLADNSHLYLGASNDINIYHSGDTSYILNSTGTLVFGTVGSTAIYFNTVDATRWLLGTTGDLYPNGTNTYNLGTSSYRVATGYFNNISLGDSNYLYLGTGNDLQIYHSGTFARLNNATGDFQFHNLNTNAYDFYFSGTLHYCMENDKLYPNTGRSIALGGGSNRWTNGYFSALDIAGNITVTGTVDGVDVSAHKHKFMYSHNYTIPGDLEAGDLVGFFVPVMSGTTVKVTEVRYQTLSGTATITLKKNGTGLTGFTSMSVTTTATSTDASDQTLADNDFLNIDIDSTSSGQDLTVSIFMEVEVTTYT